MRITVKLEFGSYASIFLGETVNILVKTMVLPKYPSLNRVKAHDLEIPLI